MKARWPWLFAIAMVAWGLYLMDSVRPYERDVPDSDPKMDDLDDLDDVPATRRTPRQPDPLPRPSPNTASVPMTKPARRPMPTLATAQDSADETDNRRVASAFARWHVGFANESRNEQWALKREATLSSSFQRMEIRGGTFDSVECRATICRVAFTFESREAKQDNLVLFQQASRLLGPRARNEPRDLPNGRHTVIMWARPN